MTRQVLASVGDDGVLNTKLPVSLSDVWIDRDVSWMTRLIADHLDEWETRLDADGTLALAPEFERLSQALAGHLDLTRTFLVNAKATPMQQTGAPAQKSAGTPALDSANPLATPLKGATGAAKSGASQKLTPSPTPGKLAPPAKNP